MFVNSNIATSSITGNTSKILFEKLSNVKQDTNEQNTVLKSAKYNEFKYRDSCLHPITEEVLSNSNIDLELRYTMAAKLSSVVEQDYALLFLIASEISRAFNGKVQRFHFGYLVEIDNHEAILIEHGYHLQVTKENINLIAKLANHYSKTLLASCNSQKLSDNFNNVQGFTNEVSVAKVIEFLAENYANVDIFSLLNLYYSSLNSYQLTVIEEAQIPVASAMVFAGVRNDCKMEYNAISNSSIFLWMGNT